MESTTWTLVDDPKKSIRPIVTTTAAGSDDCITTGVNPPSSTSTRVTYSSLPHKRQLAILMLARFAEPLAASSIQSYVYFQLRHFSPDAPMVTITAQAGAIFSAKMAAHVFTAILWGRLADAPFGGRKLVLVLGLLSSTAAFVGYGFSRTFAAALAWQIVEGALNSTTSMVRCVTAELNPIKRTRARALTLLPLFANAGTLIGPLLGGFLVTTTESPSNTSILRNYPYAAPNLVIASLHAIIAVAAICGLQETSEAYKCSDSSRLNSMWNTARTFLHRGRHANDGPDESSPLLQAEHSSSQLEQSCVVNDTKPARFRDMWTSNVVSTFLALFIVAGHLGTFSQLWAMFLSIPPKSQARNDLLGAAKLHATPPNSSGGLGFDPRGVGVSISLLGTFGIILQVVIYPSLHDRFGTVPLWRAGLFVFPMVYVLAPFCAILRPSKSIEDPNSSQVLVWTMVLAILFLFVAGRTCVVPATSMLINDCAPSARVRGTIHTTGTLISNLSRTIFPAIALPIFGYGLRAGIVGLGFWSLAVLAVVACMVSVWVRDRGPDDPLPVDDIVNTRGNIPPSQI